MKKFLLYALRWQMSSIILAPCLALLQGSLGVIWATIIANGIGSIVFFFVDKTIFKK